VKFAFLMARRTRTRESFSMNAFVARVYQGSLFPFSSISLPHASVRAHVPLSLSVFSYPAISLSDCNSLLTYIVHTRE